MPSRESKEGGWRSAYRRPLRMGETGDAGTTPAPSSPAPCPPLVTGMCCGDLVTPCWLSWESQGVSHQMRGHEGRGVLAWAVGAGGCQVADVPGSLSGCPSPTRSSPCLSPTLLLPLSRPIPSKPPAALANRTTCCFRENTFWGLLSEPSQLTPTVEKTCQDKWKISS